MASRINIKYNISHDGPANKVRVINEYLKRVRKNWSSELSAYNKYISHNAFAVPVIIPTFEILDWTVDEIKQLDVKAKNMLKMAVSIHINSDVDKLYIPKKTWEKRIKIANYNI